MTGSSSNPPSRPPARRSADLWPSRNLLRTTLLASGIHSFPQHHASLSQASQNPTPTRLPMCRAHRHQTRWSSRPCPPSDSSTCQPSPWTPHTAFVLPLHFLPLSTITFSSHFSIRCPHHLVQEQPQLHRNRFMLERLYPFHPRQHPASLRVRLSRDPGCISWTMAHESKHKCASGHFLSPTTASRSDTVIVLDTDSQTSGKGFGVVKFRWKMQKGAGHEWQIFVAGSRSVACVSLKLVQFLLRNVYEYALPLSETTGTLDLEGGR